MRSNRVLFILMLVFGVMFSGIATSNGAETKRVGNTDGKAFSAACSAGMAIVGFGYNSGAQLQAIVPFCRKIDADGHTSGNVPKTGSMKGVAAGSEGKPVMCHDGQAVNRLDVTMTEYSAIYSFRATCRGPGRAPEIIKATDVSGGTAGSKSIAECKSGTIATAVVGTYKDTGANQGILSIGLNCSVPGQGGDEQPKGDDEADDKDGDDADGVHVEFDLGDGPMTLDDKDSPDLRFAKEPTTIYREPAGSEVGYLDKGETVTIIECEENGQGWCRITKPMRGYVWGSDLN